MRLKSAPNSAFKILEKLLRAENKSKQRFRPGNSRLGGKAPTRIKSVDIINGAPFHVRRILAFAQRRRNAGHNCSRDITDPALCGTVNMTAETSNNPKGILQDLAQS
jgi:hypothetical protein